MSERPHLLTYWTGKDIALEMAALSDSKRQEYLERLLSILERGFWMNKPSELVTGWSARARGSVIKYETPMTCFTEARLSKARAHSKRYGLLGIVVDRHFVLERWGGPVLYTRGHPDEALVGNVKEALAWLERRRVAGDAEAGDVRGNLLQVVAFMKSMSNPEKDDFAYLDEREWRIVFAQGLVPSGKLIAGGPAPAYRIPITHSDARLLVVPDDACRKMVARSDRFLRWAADQHIPCVTLEEAASL